MAAHPPEPGHRAIGQRELILFTIASGVVVANAYYVHPIIAGVARDFGVSQAMVGMVPAFNQIALALGIFLLLPLGDRMSNRRLAGLCLGGQTAALVVMALASDFAVFVAGSTLLGFVTIVPYLLPAYVSKRVEASRLGYATAVLTTGIIIGILLARAAAGAIGEYLSWRSVYWIAAGLMAVMTVLVPRLMEDDRPAEGADAPTNAAPGYLTLIASIGPIIRRHPDILLAGTINALGFGIFLSVWMGLGLHLTSPEMGYGMDTVGYLAGLAMLNLVTTPRLGAWADKVGARKARLAMAGLQFSGVALLPVMGHDLWLLMIPIVLMNSAGPVIDITGRMTFLSEAPEVRTRLMTIYIVFMFAGGGLASWAGTAAYDWAGWMGNSVLAITLSILVLALALWSVSRQSQARPV